MPRPQTGHRVVLASGNRGKLSEIRALLSPLGVEVVAQSEFNVPEAIENGDSFVANALIKARHASALTGLPAIADDSGIAVDALSGKPGIHSARYAGDSASDKDNIDKLLESIRDVPQAKRGAGFHCAAVFVSTANDEAPLIEEGIWRGRILESPDGIGGFGYDPVFFDESANCSSAQLTPAQKNARSHRGKAFRALCAALAERWA